MAPGQPDITSFFGTAKKVKKSKDIYHDESSAKRAKISPQSSLSTVQNTENIPDEHKENGGGHPDSQLLDRFSRGNEPNNGFYSSEEARSRKNAFANALGKRQREPQKRELKPFDLQYIELKRQNMDSILAVMNGYKYCILGKDAYAAASALGTNCFAGWKELDEGVDPEDSLYSRWASMVFPTASLMNYVQRLVAKNLKVAVADQIETAAVRASEGKSKGPFIRKVNRVFTKGTFIEEVDAAGTAGGADISGHVLALTELNGPKFAFVAVQIATGDAVYDYFEDSDLLTELETRMMHVQPGEVLKVGAFSPAVTRLIESVSMKNNVRVVSVPSPENSDEALRKYPQNVDLPSECVKCFCTLYSYLEEFNLSKIFGLKTLKPFSLRSHMCLNGDTLEALEIFQNQTDFKEVGSLFWVINCTKSRQGGRQLRRWLACPLLNQKLINQRLSAVETLIKCDAEEQWNRFRHTLKVGPDLEQRLLQLYHGRIAPKQLYFMLQTFKSLASAFTALNIRDASVQSALLGDLMTDIRAISDVVLALLSKINRTEANTEKVKLEDFFNLRECENLENAGLSELVSLQLQKNQIFEEFVQHVNDKASELGVPLSPLEILPGTTEALVIDVDKKDAKRVPKSWLKVSDTKLKVKMRSGETLELLKSYKLTLEKLETAAVECYTRFLEQIASEHYELLRQAVTAVAKLDALWALAQVSSRPGYSKPDLVENRCIDIEDGRHPMIEAMMTGRESFSYIPNSMNMNSDHSRAVVITGPNMGGKSSFVRQTALIVILGQIGCFVPAKKARFAPVDAIYTRMGAYDNMIHGESTFMVEMKQCSEILAKATKNSLILMDEIGRGTSTLDGVVIAYAVLREIVSSLEAFTLFITHYPLLNELTFEFPRLVTSWSMGCLEDEKTGQVTFLYKLVNSPASRSYGINVAQLAGVPDSILKEAERKSAEMEEGLMNRRVVRSLINLITLTLRQSSSDAISELKNFIGEIVEIPETQQV